MPIQATIMKRCQGEMEGRAGQGGKGGDGDGGKWRHNNILFHPARDEFTPQAILVVRTLLTTLHSKAGRTYKMKLK